MKHHFVGLPKKNGKRTRTFLYKEDLTTKVREVLWGDWLKVVNPTAEENIPPDWLKIKWAPDDITATFLYIKKAHTTNKRPLEIIFLDVGQGDGAILITPERDQGEAIIVIDAGENNDMHKFLEKRFNPYNSNPQFHAAIITHPDKDHYLGFKSVFADHNIGFDWIYQNGLVERPIKGKKFSKVGHTFKHDNGKHYIRNLATNKQEIEKHFADNSHFKTFSFPPVMYNALMNPKIKDFKMLSTEHATHENGRNWLPNFAPSNNRGYSIEVLGPIVEFDNDNKPQLRRISANYNKTKNGHSILLRVHFGEFKVLLGGDLNAPSEKFLLSHYTQSNFKKRNNQNEQYSTFKKAAANWFDADIMKVCHHGAADVTDEFIDIVSPGAFVISSGDQEGHVHPRPDLLGRLGKLGKSDAPVILSTELQRSTRERADREIIEKLTKNIDKLTQHPTPKLAEEIKKDINILGHSNVAVYGAIYLKTNGKDLITAFKKETNSSKDKWFCFQYKRLENGKLEATN